MAADVASVQFSRTGEKLIRRPFQAVATAISRTRLPLARTTPVSQNSTACRRFGCRFSDDPPSRTEVGGRFDAPVRFGRHARPDRSYTVWSFALTRSPTPCGRFGRGTVVLPRKEVIQPQLPLRLPCSRGSPCRHEAWTISSSSLPDAESGFEQTALPRVPRANPRREGALADGRNIEPPEIWISEPARVVQSSTTYALQLEDVSQLVKIGMVLLHELNVEPR